jgi:hypothetical protein
MQLYLIRQKLVSKCHNLTVKCHFFVTTAKIITSLKYMGKCNFNIFLNNCRLFLNNPTIVYQCLLIKVTFFWVAIDISNFKSKHKSNISHTKGFNMRTFVSVSIVLLSLYSLGQGKGQGQGQGHGQGQGQGHGQALSSCTGLSTPGCAGGRFWFVPTNIGGECDPNWSNENEIGNFCPADEPVSESGIDIVIHLGLIL